MGGDKAPTETVAGAVLAHQKGVEVVLVGDQPTLVQQLAEHSVELPIVHAPELVEMGEDPVQALREKQNSSVAIGAKLLAKQEVDGFVSAGSTGAAMAGATVLVGKLPGVLRPTIASVFPTPGSRTIMVDSGANLEVKPDHLLQFAIMGGVFAQVYLSINQPRIGLLNVGEEAGKGRRLERQTYDLLSATEWDFIGNVDGRDLTSDRVDVIVTDGFSGNVFLKAAEGAAQMVVGLLERLRQEAPPDSQHQLSSIWEQLRSGIDHEETGGAHLLGTKGVVVIAHGASSRRAICNALLMAHEGADRQLVERIAAGVG